ncbi:spondin domain-containing protein [Motilimonas pumila]|uniref:Uncharacterized protein n=1 Tax=Motilimonas pumila TaxID=2303987 RepID=A0A418YEW5_9GAMM|nr:spondin domain-containing protein [Motilimonas pumila]RJG47736.1 hypothetical protein D1Z90_10050 [Motilimonas pumila]
MKTLLPLTLIGLFSASAQAAELDITITNATGGIAFTPLAVATHQAGINIYQIGAKASGGLTALAEGGNTAGVISEINQSGYGYAKQYNPEGGLTLPGQGYQFSIDTMDYEYLSLAAMLLPSNDGFVGLNSWKIPTKAGSYTIKLNGYDAGTELNDEIVNGGGAPGVAGIPAAPTGMQQTGAEMYPYLSETGYVHIHPGIVGDTDSQGGYSDLDSRVHRFLNPVANITITVKQDAVMAWDGEQVEYQVDEQVTYMDVVYKVVHAHTSSPTWTPSNVWFFEAIE